MRDVTAEELDCVNGGSFEEFASSIGSMFQSWFGSPQPQNVSLTNTQATQIMQACIAAGGNASFQAQQGTGGLQANGTVAGGSFNINGTNQSVSCWFYA